MHLNTIDYINTRKQLMEMIGLTEKIEGIISYIENAARKDCKKEEKISSTDY